MKIDNHHASVVVQLCGFRTVAMLDYLERSGVFVPSVKRSKVRGRRRRYSFRDVLVLKTIKGLLDNGVSVATLKESLEKMQKIRWKADEATLENENGGLKYLVASGGQIYFAKNDEELINVTLGGQLTFSFIIDLDRLHTDLARDWHQRSLRLVN